MSDLMLRIDSSEFSGWEHISVRRSMQDLAGSFDLQVTERWAENPVARRIQSGARCQVLIDDVPVITGSVDATPVDYDSSMMRLSVQGRDRTGDLVDCSAPALQWIGRSIAQVAAELCKPFGIEVINLAKADRAFRSYKPGDGESVFEMLDKAARMRGVLLTTDGRGRLVITRVGASKAGDSIELGRNVISASGSHDLRDCFSVYTVKGQQQGGVLDDEAACHVVGKARDTRIVRHRPITLLCDGPADSSTAREKAIWERNVRTGRSESITYTLYGWRQANGDLWQPNLLVPVLDEYQRIDGERLITDVSYSIDDRGEICELTVMPVSAFALALEKEPEVDDEL